MDDLADRFLKTIGLICAGFLLIYFLIATSGEKPSGVSLLIFNSMNWLFYWLFRLFVLGFLGFASMFIKSRYAKAQAEKEWQIREAVKKQEREIQEKERWEKEIEQKRIEAEREAQTKKVAETEKLRRQIEREEYLKNRSAEAAIKDALKDFV